MLFFDETCSIYSPTATTTDGEQVTTLALAEASVPCAFYGPSNSYAPGQFAQNQGTEAYTLVLPGSKASLAVKGRTVDVAGLRFVIDSVQVHKIPSGAADNAECRLSQRFHA